MSEFNPVADIALVGVPDVVFVYKYPEAVLTHLTPQGTLDVLLRPVGNLLVASVPAGTLSYNPPLASIEKLSVPIGALTQVFFTPVLAIGNDNEFLWLDDGGRLQIEY